MFRVAAQNRVFQDVVNQIQDAILDGKLSRGDILPSERELRVMFNTSRGTLREALRVLEERGLIEIKLGVHGGAIVRGANAEQVTRSLARLIRSQQISLDYLAEFREGIEGNVASLAAQRATPHDGERLQALLEKARTAITQDPIDRESFLVADRHLHQELAVITGNPIYIFVIQTIHENIHRYYDRYLSINAIEFQENFQDLCDLAHAVTTGSADEARLLAQSHVLRFNRRMKVRQHADIAPAQPLGQDALSDNSLNLRKEITR
jgi:GntR family transcriptional regulator, transcriptional repressor for pyruvate dehydrogenase complex